MKSRHPFTLTECIVVLIILGILTIFVIPLFYGGCVVTPNLHSRANLSKIGKAIMCYASDITHGYFPTKVGRDANKELDQTAWEASIKNPNRSTVKTMDVLFNSDADLIPPIDTLVSPLNRALTWPELKPNGDYEPLTSKNVGYHYVNGDIKKAVFDENRGLMRDLNEGYEEHAFGLVLTGDFRVKRIEAQTNGSWFSPKITQNWYQNDKLFPNYKDFDHYDRKIDPKKPDEVD